jgi:hypothetical protein
MGTSCGRAWRGIIAEEVEKAEEAGEVEEVREVEEIKQRACGPRPRTGEDTQNKPHTRRFSDLSR